MNSTSSISSISIPDLTQEISIILSVREHIQKKLRALEKRLTKITLTEQLKTSTAINNDQKELLLKKPLTLALIVELNEQLTMIQASTSATTKPAVKEPLVQVQSTSPIYSLDQVKEVLLLFTQKLLEQQSPLSTTLPLTLQKTLLSDTPFDLESIKTLLESHLEPVSEKESTNKTKVTKNKTEKEVVPLVAQLSSDTVIQEDEKPVIEESSMQFCFTTKSELVETLKEIESDKNEDCVDEVMLVSGGLKKENKRMFKNNGDRVKNGEKEKTKDLPLVKEQNVKDQKVKEVNPQKLRIVYTKKEVIA